MNEKPNQAMKVLAYMFTHEDGITPLEALNELGCMRLGARVWELKHKHLIPIKSVMEEHELKDGTKKRYARYFIEKGER